MLGKHFRFPSLNIHKILFICSIFSARKQSLAHSTPIFFLSTVIVFFFFLVGGLEGQERIQVGTSDKKFPYKIQPERGAFFMTTWPLSPKVWWTDELTGNQSFQ